MLPKGHLKTTLLVLSFVLVILLTLRIRKNDTQDWKRYVNGRYSFSISYPHNLELGEAPTNDDGITFTSQDEEIICRIYGYRNVSDATLTNETSIIEVEDLYRFVKPEIRIVEQKDIMFGKRSAKHVVVENAEGEVIEIAFRQDEEGRNLMCEYTDQAAWKEFSETFEKMYKSYREP